VIEVASSCKHCDAISFWVGRIIHAFLLLKLLRNRNAVKWQDTKEQKI